MAYLIDVPSFEVATCRKSERAEGAHLRYLAPSVLPSVRPFVDVCPTERKKIESEAPLPPIPRRSGKIGRSLLLGRDPLQPERILLHCEAIATAVGHARAASAENK